MPRAGQVRLATNRQAVAEAAMWLDGFFPEPPAWAAALSAIFRKAAERKRQHTRFTMLIDRQLADQFANRREAAVLSGTAPPSVIQMMQSCAAGRGRRELTQAEREAREKGLERSTSDDRHRKRVAREARYERAVRGWQSSHGSLLGSAGTEAAGAFPKK